MSFQYNSYSVPLVLAAVIAAVLGLTIWRRRPAPGAGPFVVLMAGVSFWSLCGALEHASVDAAAKLLFSNLSYVGITTAPATWLAFALEYTGREKWLTRRNIALLFVEPVLTVLAAFSNPVHNLFRSQVLLDTASGPYPALAVTFGPLFWVHAAYSYVLLLGGAILLIRAFVRSPELYRGQITFLLIGALAPWLANAIFIFGFSPWPNLDLTPFAFTITGASMAWSIYRYRLMDIVPVARDMVIENMGDALLVLDARNRIVDINPAGLALVGGRHRSEIIGQQVEDVFSTERELVNRYRNVDHAQAEIELDQEGARRAFELRISPLRNRQGDLTGRLALLHDITLRKQAAEQIQQQNEALVQANRELSAAREQAEEANRLKSEFLATISHELRTPLNAVIGYADLMQSGMGGALSEKHLDYVGRISSNGERLLKLINEVLDLSRIEAGRLELISQPYLPADVLARVKSQMQALASHAGLELIADIDAPLASRILVGDPSRIEQILVNLVGNGIKFTKNGKVEIWLRRDGETHWELVVRDTGIGIPPHALQLIFEPFRQVDGTSQREYEGSGLGLAIVQRLAVLMGGTVNVESEVNVGSTFTVRLPLALAEEAPAHIEGASAHAGKQ